MRETSRPTVFWCYFLTYQVPLTTYRRYLRLLFPPSPFNDHLYSQYSLLRQIGSTTEACSNCRSQLDGMEALVDVCNVDQLQTSFVATMVHD